MTVQSMSPNFVTARKNYLDIHLVGDKSFIKKHDILTSPPISSKALACPPPQKKNHASRGDLILVL